MDNLTEILLTQTEQDPELNYYYRLQKSKNSEEFKTNIISIVTRLGYSDISIVNVDFFDHPQYIFTTLPKTYTNQYIALNTLTKDMLLRRSLNNNQPFYASPIFTHALDSPVESDAIKTTVDAYDLNKHFGFYESFNISFKTGVNTILISSTIRGAVPVEFVKRVMKNKQSLALLFEAIAKTLIHKFNELLSSKSLHQTPIIKPKPLNVIATLANSDLTINQVADKLCISVVTANQHLKGIRTKLGVRTNHAAIRALVLDGQIELIKSV